MIRLTDIIRQVLRYQLDTSFSRRRQFLLTNYQRDVKMICVEKIELHGVRSQSDLHSTVFCFLAICTLFVCVTLTHCLPATRPRLCSLDIADYQAQSLLETDYRCKFLQLQFFVSTQPPLWPKTWLQRTIRRSL